MMTQEIEDDKNADVTFVILLINIREQNLLFQHYRRERKFQVFV